VFTAALFFIGKKAVANKSGPSNVNGISLHSCVHL